VGCAVGCATPTSIHGNYCHGNYFVCLILRRRAANLAPCSRIEDVGANPWTNWTPMVRLNSPGHLAASRRARVRWPHLDSPRRTVQVPLPAHGPAPADLRPLAPRINATSVLVDDQAKALAFYTDVLGFQKKTDVPLVVTSSASMALPSRAGWSASPRPPTQVHHLTMPPQLMDLLMDLPSRGQRKTAPDGRF
jgi:Glyoxalase/Bleomycin resistance protein/Dioxygenase superfamily